MSARHTKTAQPPRKRATVSPQHLALAHLMHALATGCHTHPQLAEISGLHHSTVGRLLRAMLRPAVRTVRIAAWEPRTWTPHNALSSVTRLTPRFSLGTDSDAEVPAHLAHITRAHANYD